MTATGRARGSIVDELPATGDLLFRWRSYAPLLLFPLFALSLLDDRPPTPFGLEAAAFIIALSGLGLRVFVVGTAPEGTSTRGTTSPTAPSLNTSGAYSSVRHPLYLANTVMWLGCALVSATWYLPAIVLLLSFVYHERIAAREEAFLRATFGEQFLTWAADVPAMVPRVSGYRPSGVRFQARKALLQETHGLCALGTTFLVLDTMQRSVRLGALHVDPRWLAVFAITLVPFLFMIAAKKTARMMAKA